VQRLAEPGEYRHQGESEDGATGAIERSGRLGQGDAHRSSHPPAKHHVEDDSGGRGAGRDGHAGM